MKKCNFLIAIGIFSFGMFAQAANKPNQRDFYSLEQISNMTFDKAGYFFTKESMSYRDPKQMENIEKLEAAIKERYGELWGELYSGPMESLLMEGRYRCAEKNSDFQRRFPLSSSKEMTFLCTDKVEKAFRVLDEYKSSVKQMSLAEYEKLNFFQYLQLPEFNTAEYIHLKRQEERGELVLMTAAAYSKYLELCVDYNLKQFDYNDKQRNRIEKMCNATLKQFSDRVKSGKTNPFGDF